MELFIIFTCFLSILAQEEQEQNNEQDKDEVDKTLVYIVVTILIIAFGYFIYNFYVCHKKKIDLGSHEDFEEHQEGIEIQGPYNKKDNL